jgi:RNA polymerase-binding protein DksA
MNPTNQKRSHPAVSSQWRWHYETLRSLRERLIEDRDVQREEAHAPLVRDTNDLADCATDEFDHDLAFRLLSQEESALQEVDAALHRIEQGTYGVCEETGRAIPPARLSAVPWTRYSIAAQKRLEEKERGPAGKA